MRCSTSCIHAVEFFITVSYGGYLLRVTLNKALFALIVEKTTQFR